MLTTVPEVIGIDVDDRRRSLRRLRRTSMTAWDVWSNSQRTRQEPPRAVVRRSRLQRGPLSPSSARHDRGFPPPPVETRNPRVLGSSEPTPEEPLCRGGAQGGSGSRSPNWSPNGGVQGEPVQEILRSTYILAGQSRTPCHRVRLRLLHGAAIRAFSGANTAPVPRACGVGGQKTTAPSTSDHCVPAALPRLA